MFELTEETARSLSITLVLLGTFTYFVTRKAERYHSDRFRRHGDDLQRSDPADTPQLVEQFYHDRWVRMSAVVMQWGYILAATLFVFVAWVVWWWL
jgi:protein tyrosine phosphatase